MQTLPLDPYVLGYWLGDGDSDGPRVTTHSADLAHFLKYCEQVGLSTTGLQRTHGETYRVRFASGSREGAQTDGGRAVGVNALRELGVLGNKHIPTRVMRLDIPSRMKVLQGLMDSDGTIDPQGKVELCFTSRCLAIDCTELLRSLGFYPRMRESDAALRGRVVGTRYRINFTAYSDDPVFLLPRKSARLKSRPQTMPYSQVRTVIAITEVDSVPLRRVTVSGGSNLYLAGVGLVPTYSSHPSQDHL
ncbi:LAGLIDADG family homing endonuclease [Nocardia fluminea]|uniref:LAGLIDADG family homing endonuclease n=1 Tax=Nocardia fluminea TaxID=134984 RepID=UPI003661CCEB